MARKPKVQTVEELTRIRHYRSDNAAAILSDYSKALIFAEWLQQNKLLNPNEDINALALDYVGRDAEMSVLKSMGIER